MKDAGAGKTIRSGDGGPPWIVVDHSIESIIPARWPGKLWEVEILKAAADQPMAYANYTRAVSVRVIGERPVHELFGPHGQAVCAVIERAGAVTMQDVELLVEAAHPDAPSAYSRAWSRWLGRTEAGEDHAHTLAVAGNARSPIGSGFTVLYSVLTERARNLTGDAAFVVDEEGGQSFVPAWDTAASAFLHAAMALGAPELIPREDAEALTAAWLRL